MEILLDTCSLIWAVSAPDRLSEHCRLTLLKSDARVFLSPVSAAELACAQDRGRIELDRHWRLWLKYFRELNDWEEIPISLRIAEEAYSLPPPFHQDPADRILVATARVHGLFLATADEKLLSYPHVETLW